MAGDAELAARAAVGDQRAAGEIYDRYAPLVRAILLDATGSLAEANDLVQEVFLWALGRLNQLRRGEALGGWLVEIARREGVEYRRQMARRRRRFSPLADEAEQTGDESRAHEIDAVREAIRRLPERERMAVHVHYLCGEPAEVARQALGLSPSGFYKLLGRARERLRTMLLEMEGRR
jgi:RNA polymerase sigma-70 factor (ECF subfamily)